MNSQAADPLDRVFGEQRRLEGERMRRLRAGPMWVMAHENTVRTAELALKLLIKAVAPAPAGQRPEFGKHDLSALWYHRLYTKSKTASLYASVHSRRNPYGFGCGSSG